MKKSFIKRSMSTAVAGVMLFTSTPIVIPSFADSDSGVGIYNHVYPEGSSADTRYVLTFYKNFGNDKVTFPDDPNGMEISGSHYLSSSGGDATFFLTGGDKVDLSSSPAFIEFVKTNNIDKIDIKYVTGSLNQKDTSLLYEESDTKSYVFYNDVVTTDPVTQEQITTHVSLLDYDSNNPFAGYFAEYSPTLMEYRSTLMKEFTVEQQWRDRGDPNIRPDIKDITFDIKRSVGDGEPELLTGPFANAATAGLVYKKEIADTDAVGGKYGIYMEMTAPNSNSYLYTYTLPACDKDGNVYNYSSAQNRKASDPELKPDNYKDLPPSAPDKYLAVGLTDFTFTLNWQDAYDTQARPTINADLLNEYFTLNLLGSVDENGDPVTIEITPEKLTVDPGMTAVTIKGLEDINELGTANEYYLSPKKKGNGDEKIKKINVNDDSPNANHEKDDEGNTADYYAFKTENTGLHANDIDNTYTGGEMNLRLTGTTDFSGTIKWDDNEKSVIRENDDSATYFDLWRYAGTEAEFEDADAAKYYDAKPVGGKENFSFTGLDKYDINGQLYTYYAVESVSVEEGTGDNAVKLPYQITYKEGNAEKDVLFNNGTVINKLSDKIKYTVSADWTAAARQGGTASATYMLQRKKKGETEWKNVESKTITFDELHMSRKNDSDCRFEEVDMYDENGDLYEYRVIQNSISRTDELTDENVSGTDDRVFGDGIDEPNGKTVLEFKDNNNKPVLDEYDATLQQVGNDFHFHYQIKGDTVVTINKEWQYRDSNGKWINIPESELAENGYKAKFNVQNFSNADHDYIDYFVENDYPEHYFDSYIASGYYYRKTYFDGEWRDDAYMATATTVTTPAETTATSATEASEDTSEGSSATTATTTTLQKRIYFNADNTVLSGNTWTVNDIDVPKFDEDGREIAYRAVENGIEYPTEIDGETVGYYQTYSWNVDYIGTNDLTTRYNYKIINHRTYPGNDHMELAVNKVWVDDGEQEFRKPVRIIAAEGVGEEITGTGSDASVTVRPEQEVTLSQSNVWEGRIDISHYKKNANGQYISDGNGKFELMPLDDIHILENPDWFSEAPVDPTENVKYYWSLSEIEKFMEDELHITPDSQKTGYEWIYNLLSKKEWNYEYTDPKNPNSETNKKEISISPANGYFTDVNSTDLMNENFVNFSGSAFGGNSRFVGIYKSKALDGNGKRCHYYAVREELSPGGVNGADGTLRFINTRIGVTNFEVQFDWNVGDALTKGDPLDPDKPLIQKVTFTVSYTGSNGETILIEKEIDPLDLAELDNGNKAYYLLNLPKYDINGKLIDYKIKEISINDQVVNDTPDAAGNDHWVNIGNDHCAVSITSDFITEGKEAKTDDLHTIVFTNTFVDDTDITVHKRWVDNQNAEYTRPDLYIKLFRISEKPDSVEEQVGKEYKWVKGIKDTIDYWTYTYEDFPKYDKEGYRYTYYVKEQDYIYQYNQKYSNIENNPDVHIESPPENVAYNEGTITNSLYGVITLNGEKLWRNMAGILQKKDYPIAYVTLYRGDQQISGVKEVRSGETRFKFDQATQDAIDNDLVITKTENGVKQADIRYDSIVLPKYDETGKRITYTIKERPINGYLSRIEQGSHKLINEYNGGRKLQFKVNKKWKGMTANDVYPTIKFTLHQVFCVEDSSQSDGYKYYEYNHFSREEKVTDDFTVTFGDDAHPHEQEALRYYSPIGEPFKYFVTETLSNYDGEQVLFINEEDAKWIPEYIKSFTNNGTNSKAYVEYLNSDKQAEKLGFISEVTEQLDDAKAVAAASLSEGSVPSDEDIDEELRDDTAEPLKLKETVQNTYAPENKNFQGKIDVSKSWDNKDHDEYNGIKAYSFTLSRKTKLLNSEGMFTVKTSDSYSNPNTPSIKANTEAGYSTDGFYPSSSSDRVEEPAEGVDPSYYIAYVKKDWGSGSGTQNEVENIKIVIDTTDNKVNISNLAIYGQDALKYYYTVEENEKQGYSIVTGKDTKQFPTDPQISVSLKNKLDVFNLKINKSFGREYEDTVDGGTETVTKIEPIPVADYAQFFNDEYFNQLEFHIYRRAEGSELPEEIGYDGKAITDSPSNLLTGAVILGDLNDDTHSKQPAPEYGEDTGETSSKRYATIYNLPLTDIYGKTYTYWVEEVDHAQFKDDGNGDPIQKTNEEKHVSTYYSIENNFTESRNTTDSSDTTKIYNSKQNIVLSSEDKDNVKNTYIQNVFEAKKININKYWLDNNNEDGLRPDSMEVTIYEQLKKNTDPITFNRVLNKENSSGENGWTLEAALAKYYFNGTEELSGLKYKIGETLPAGYASAETIGEAVGKSYYLVTDTNHDYLTGEKDGNGAPTSYSIGTGTTDDAPVSDVDYKSISGTSFDTLNLTNYKIPQKGELELTKAFDPSDENFKADTRPEKLYFKLTDGNDNVFTDYSKYQVTVNVGDSPASPNENGVITVPIINSGEKQYSYPAVTVSNLPIGSSENGDVQINGTYTAKQYKFVECDKDGIVLTGDETFPYNWKGKDADTSSQTVTFDANDKPTPYTESYQITNTLKTVKRGFRKEWIDENNIYNTRKPITLELQTKLENESEWKTVNVKPDENSVDVWTADGTNTVQQITQNNPSNNSVNTQSGLFIGLPQYNDKGIPYQYRVVEKKIGEAEVNSKYNEHDATHNYFVVYGDEEASDTSPAITVIKNEIIKYEPSQDFIIKKNWDDTDNQDDKRPEEMNVYLVQREWQSDNNDRFLVGINSFAGTLNEANDWTYEWKDYPGFSENGNEYTYAVVEYYDNTSEVTDLNDIWGGHVTTNTDLSSHRITKQVTKNGTQIEYIDDWREGTHESIGSVPNLYEQEVFKISEPKPKVDENGNPIKNEHGDDINVQNANITNKHDQYFRSLTVNKQWLGDNIDGYQKLRPESITFDLYCKYTTYKYVYEENGVQTVCDTREKRDAAFAAGKTLQIVEDTTYDGPVNGENSLIKDHFTTDGSHTKELIPSNKESDEDWKNQITFDHLPVYLNNCADERWNGQACAIEYYVKEKDPPLENGKENPYTYGVDSTYTNNENHIVNIKSYKKNETDSNNSNITDLLNGTTPSNKTVTAANELKTRNIAVEKRWDDSGYGDGDSLHYDIDFTLKGKAGNYSYAQTQTVNPDNTVTFTNVPIYALDGSIINYSVSERVHNKNSDDNHSQCSDDATHQYGYYISRYSMTENNISNYTDNTNHNTYEITPTSGIVNYYTIVNKLPVIEIRAEKVWDDNNNQDGKRPQSLTFSMLRNGESVSGVSNKTDGSDNHTEAKITNDHASSAEWEVDFGVQPVKDMSNTDYTYRVTEAAVEEYSSVTPAKGTKTTDPDNKEYYIETADNGDLTFHFKNKYTPPKDSLQIIKQWDDKINDIDYADYTRPTSVTVTLYAAYNGSLPVNLAEADSSNPVRALFDEYAFTKTINGAISSDTWTATFSDLPLNVNPTGTAVYNGTSYPITYSVKETELKGYTTNDSAKKELNTDTNDSLTVKNTLKTKTVKVNKVWDDHGYSGDQAHHYDVNITLANAEHRYSMELPITQAGNGEATFILPEYFSDEKEATYKITETPQNFGYVTTYSSNISGAVNNEFDATKVTNDKNLITVTNTLPLTEVSLTKTWVDQSNTYQLRPDNITVNLLRKLESDADWTTVASNVKITGNTTDKSWSHTFSKLPKFAENNQPYIYKIEEAHVNAYDTTYTPVSVKDNNDPANSALSFGITNTLITKPITLKKVWIDHGYTATHDTAVTFTVSYPTVEDGKAANIAFEDMPIKLDPSDKTSETWTKQISIPVYDKDGNTILYKVTEPDSYQYGYYQTTDENGKIVEKTKNGSHAGYNNYYYDSYTITNELPVTNIKAKKEWAGDQEKYPQADVKVDLTRKSTGNTWESVLTDQKLPLTADTTNNLYTENNIEVTNGNLSVEFKNLLAQDEDNHAYTYQITEKTVKGYQTEYSPENHSIALTDTNRTVTITNTPKRSEAEFTKYDKTDYDKHKDELNFTLLTLQGAKFKLYRKGTIDNIVAVKATVGNGVYEVVKILTDGSEAPTGATTELVSGADGKIIISNLEPNEYYLVETNAPTGYQPNGTKKYYFKVDVDDSNEISTTYNSTEDNINSLTVKLHANDTNASKVNGIPNEENMSQLTLTKVDAINDSMKLPNAYYYLLRLKDYKYKDANAEGDTESDYLAKALDALNADLNVDNDPYWEKVGNSYYKTDDYGKITVNEGQMFGTYVFYEVKAPVGYNTDGTYSDVIVPTDTTANITKANVLGPVEFKTNNAEHNNIVYDLTHLEPRKEARIKILKTDESGKPLKDAVFKLYKDGDDTNVIASVNTGYDGMNPTAIILDTTQYDWGTKFYFIEENAPKGYSTDNQGDNKNKIEFILTRELADETLHIVRANDSRLKGKVTLTKVSGQATTQAPAGSPLSGAEFELHNSDGTKLNVYQKSDDTGYYRVAADGDTNEVITAAGYTFTPLSTLTTYDDGKLHIENLDWGDYYLQEVTPPTGYKINANADKVYFSVGRTNCGDKAQKLTMKNVPNTAKLNIAKHIDVLNTEAWGETTFIFKIRQTQYYDYSDSTFKKITGTQPTLTKTITPTTEHKTGETIDYYHGATGTFDVEPGTYEITEVLAARYEPNGDASITGTDYEEGALKKDSATLSINPDGSAEVTFKNKLTTYEKLSHADKEINTFNGSKAIKVSDKYDLELGGTANADNEYSITIQKSELEPKLVKSDGTTVDITEYSKLVISTDENEITVTNNGSSITVTGRKEDVCGSIYKLTAEYDGLTTEFELGFKADPMVYKTEKTVIFNSDAANMSYYDDNNKQNDIYTLIFIYHGSELKKILHNGTATEKEIPILNIHSMFADKAFDKWSYTINGDTKVYYADDDTALRNAINTAPPDAVINVTPVLKDKTHA